MSKGRKETSCKRTLKCSTNRSNPFILAEAAEDNEEVEYELPDKLDFGEEDNEAFNKHLADELRNYASADLLPPSAGTSHMIKDTHGFWNPIVFNDIEAQYTHSDGFGYHSIQSPTPPPLPEISSQSESLTVRPNLIFVLSASAELESPALLVNGTTEAEVEVGAGGARAKRRVGGEDGENDKGVFEADLELDVDPSLAGFYDQLWQIQYEHPGPSFLWNFTIFHVRCHRGFEKSIIKTIQSDILNSNRYLYDPHAATALNRLILMAFASHRQGWLYLMCQNMSPNNTHLATYLHSINSFYFPHIPIVTASASDAHPR
ncbi:hypothetical protein GYMLUDRAFT_248298 [Collybiopsis luxurians FD-317 M1]|uniref:Uncharacterized protein n=1 Tax=Collybiopsis luxurians FD-317 M1 TaxID=944289 RepID=A0A0D0C0M9_9AGAR|nr:hypothetical protein GYMLUDRAFT_248298 [Collybiopsis luxurians FD-317 M1]